MPKMMSFWVLGDQKKFHGSTQGSEPPGRASARGIPAVDLQIALALANPVFGPRRPAAPSLI